MSRNKYPEKTVQKILDVSFHLFAEKGYEKTTIQDIVCALGMSKGAIYHHFSSKEAILEALSKHSFETRNSDTITRQNDLNGVERIQQFMKLEFSSIEKQSLDRISMALFRVPKYTMMLIENTLKINAPVFAKMVEEAIEDGSATVKDAQMCAEVMMLLSNIWINPIAVEENIEQIMRRVKTLKIIMDGLGLPIFDDELIQIIRTYFERTLTA